MPHLLLFGRTVRHRSENPGSRLSTNPDCSYKLSAPSKQLLCFEHSGHDPSNDKPAHSTTSW